ncbi:Serine/Threonine kinase family protein, partial [Thalictrum thalictroides]
MVREEETNLLTTSSSSTTNNTTTTSSSNTNTSTSEEATRPSSRPDLLRHVQAALKRHRPLGTMQCSNIRPRRVLLPQREPLKISTSSSVHAGDSEKSQDVALNEDRWTLQRVSLNDGAETAVCSSFAHPSVTETITKTHIEDANLFGAQKVDNKSVFECKGDSVGSSSHIVPQPISVNDCHKKVQFSLGENAFSQRADKRMATGMELLSSHVSSLALTEIKRDVSNLGQLLAFNDHDKKQQDCRQQIDLSESSLRSDGGISSLLAKRSLLVQNPFLGKEISHPSNQSSVAGSSCMTTISVYSKSAPALNSTTYNSRPCQDGMDIEPVEEPNLNPQHISQGYVPQLSHPTYQYTSGMLADSSAAPTQLSISSLVTNVETKDHEVSQGQQGFAPKEIDRLVEGLVDRAKGSSVLDDQSTKEKGHPADVSDVQSQAPVTKSSYSRVKAEPFKSDKQEKAATNKGASGPRKKNHDPDQFVKVNGKLYQKLGKIGSGGSSEVYKVISAECTIYALKRIKLKGRDYSTAYGFCQEVQYLNKLKGKNNIIQLIDYEVTDKTLLDEVMNGAMNIKDGRIRDDGYIYMVLEYGEIDLAHMLSQKWKEQDSANWTMDENWLRFYWQ